MLAMVAPISKLHVRLSKFLNPLKIDRSQIHVPAFHFTTNNYESGDTLLESDCEWENPRIYFPKKSDILKLKKDFSNIKQT